MSFIYRQIKVSINRFLIDWAKENLVVGQGSALPGSAQTGEYFWRTSNSKLYRFGGEWIEVALDDPLYDFDAHADTNPFPGHDFVGQRSLTLMLEPPTVSGGVLIGVSAHIDDKLQKHDVLMDRLAEALQPRSMIPLVDMSTGIATGKYLVVLGGMEVMPMAKADNRPIQFIGFDFECDAGI